MDGSCWSGSAAGAVGGTVGPVTLRSFGGGGDTGMHVAPSVELKKKTNGHNSPSAEKPYKTDA